MSDEELYDLICKELYVNEGQADGEYKHKNLAEYIERAYYVCPDCGLTTYVSQGDTFTCQKCQKMVRYLPTKELKGEGFDFPFRFTTEWYDYQSEFINGLDTLALGDTLLYTDKVAFFEVKLYDKKYSIDDNATVKLYGSGIVVETKEKTYSFPFAEISTASVLGRNKVNLYFEGSVYQLKGNERFNGVKFVQLCYRTKNILKGEENGKFLGL